MTSPKNKLAAVPFSLAKIQTLEFAIIDRSYSADEEIEITQQFNFSVDTETMQVAIAPRYEFLQVSSPFLILEVQCVFNIAPIAWKEWMNMDTGVFTLPKNIATHMAVLSVGTTRGTLHAKTEGTHLNMFVLPTWNLSEIIKEDWSVKVEK